MLALNVELEEAVAAGGALVEHGFGYRSVGFGRLQQIQHLAGTEERLLAGAGGMSVPPPGGASTREASGMSQCCSSPCPLAQEEAAEVSGHMRCAGSPWEEREGECHAEGCY